MKKPFLSRLCSRLSSRLLSQPVRRFVAKNLALPAFLGGTAAAISGSALAQNAAPVAATHSVQWWEAIILGLVQGLSEFIPISSSAHLNITHKLMGHPRELAFDVLLHVGTLAALIYYFKDDYKALIVDPAKRKLRNLVLLGCVPAVLLGVPLEKLQDKPPLSEVWFNAIMLAVAGTILLLADKLGKQRRDLESVENKDAIIVGVAQALALIPGVSRSGSTLTAGLMLGLKRADAARFSFLLSLPITIGAVLFEARHLVTDGFGAVNASPLTMLLGVVASAASGFWAIGFLLNYLKSKDVTPFFVWRLVVALVVFALFRPQ